MFNFIIQPIQDIVCPKLVGQSIIPTPLLLNDTSRQSTIVHPLLNIRQSLLPQFVWWKIIKIFWADKYGT
jgi:hypothetical protein